ncbi:hypothetical protein BDFB_009052 [Asbolus verrucosus]|uniref:Uncharacterized protein n=1 Tax=Asbolus verrucosus TaxID=1661398 RepID=A0A482VZ64_ASBVE|nr:hypothetical protein BDFB_009052 [Asbolus verrucosus]
MYLMYYLDDQGNRVYTLNVENRPFRKAYSISSPR